MLAALPCCLVGGRFNETRQDRTGVFWRRKDRQTNIALPWHAAGMFLHVTAWALSTSLGRQHGLPCWHLSHTWTPCLLTEVTLSHSMAPHFKSLPFLTSKTGMHDSKKFETKQHKTPIKIKHKTRTDKTVEVGRHFLHSSEQPSKTPRYQAHETHLPSFSCPPTSLHIHSPYPSSSLSISSPAPTSPYNFLFTLPFMLSHPTFLLSLLHCMLLPFSSPATYIPLSALIHTLSICIIYPSLLFLSFSLCYAGCW